MERLVLTPPRHTSEGMKPGHMPHPSTVGSGHRAIWVCRQRPWTAAHIVVTVVSQLRVLRTLNGVFVFVRGEERDSGIIW